MHVYLLSRNEKLIQNICVDVLVLGASIYISIHTVQIENSNISNSSDMLSGNGRITLVQCT